MDVDDRDLEVPLPGAIEAMLRTICSKHSLQPLEAEPRRILAEIGEAESLRILDTIAGATTVRNLPGFIKYLRRNPPAAAPSPSPSPPPKNPRLADSHDRSPSFSRKETVTVRYFLTPPEASKEIRQTEMEALGELEFRKQFLILNYIGGNELHTVLTADEIVGFKDLRMAKLEEQLWKRFGGKCVERQDRVLYNDWDSGRTHVYHCHVSQKGSYRFKGPFLESTKTHLQRTLGDENVLMVKFAEDVTIRDNYYAGYSKICREGILVGSRLYCFYVFKDGGKEEKKKNPTSSPVKCFFVCVHSDALIDQNSSYILYRKPMHERRYPFMHVHTVSSVSNYIARFSLILSKTFKMSDLKNVNIERIEDIYCKDESGAHVYRDEKALIHTDGTGFISEDLALLCPKNLHKGECVYDKIQIINSPDKHEENAVETALEQSGIGMQEPPMLIQCRLFYNGYAIKGTLLVNKKLKPGTIQIRHSMVKVEQDPNLLNYETVNSLEVVKTSNAPKKTFLSRNLIALLSYGGVPDNFFLDLLGIALREADSAFSNKRVAFKAAINYGNMDNDFTVARMISCGIPLEESYLQYRLSILMKEEKKSLRNGKLHVPDCFYLMGTADPTGKLKSDEVCIVLDKGQLSGRVLVYRNPGLHFGDIHILKATYIEELVSFVGNAKYAIFFPINGPRSIGDEIAGGDFDGDMYWVSMNPELLRHLKQTEPWIQKPSTSKVESKRPDQISNEELEDELIKLFLKTRFEPSFAKSEAADSWLALMDRFLSLGGDCIEEKNAVKQNLIKLIDIYYDALNAPKKGTKVEVPRELRPKKFPHYMERENSFKSESILGKIYDEVDAYEQEDNSKKEIHKLPCFDVEVPEVYMSKWALHYKNYREDMTDALRITERVLKNNAAEDVKKKYKMLLYGAEELEDSTRNIDDIYNEALAIYHLSYDHASGPGNVSNCSFAWNVAGSALFKLHAVKHGGGERTFVMLPTVLKELF